MSTLTDDDMSMLLAHVGSARGGRGPKARQDLAVSLVRELNPADLELVLNPPPVEARTVNVARLRSTHHQIARLLADGHKNVEVSRVTGYSQSRISILLNDPAFSELVEYYKAEKKQVYLDVHTRMASLGQDAVEEIQSRLDENPESFSLGQLIAVTELTMDRTVAPKKTLAPPAQANNGMPALIQINMVRSPASGQELVTVDVAASPSEDEGLPL